MNAKLFLSVAAAVLAAGSWISLAEAQHDETAADLPLCRLPPESPWPLDIPPETRCAGAKCKTDPEWTLGVVHDGKVWLLTRQDLIAAVARHPVRAK